MDDSERLVAQTAIARKLLSEESFKRCLLIQKVLERYGQRVALRDIFLKEKAMTEFQVKSLEEELLRQKAPSVPASRQAPAVPVAPAVAPKPVARASPPPVAATARVAPVGSAANPAGTPASPATAPKPPVPKDWSSYPKLKTPEPAGAAQGPSVSLPHNGRWSLSGCDVRGRATSLPGRERTEQVAVVLEFEGLLNSEAGPELEQLLRGMLQAGFYWLVLHLQNLEFMASSCYGAIFGVSQELYLRGGAIAVCHAQPGIQRAIKTLALEEFVRVCEDESSALQALVKR